MRLWQVCGLAGLSATVLYVLDLSPLLNACCLLAVGAGTSWACFAGPRRHDARPRGAWLLMGAAALVFLVGVLVRPLVEGMPLIADAATLSGYLLIFAFLGGLLRARRGVERHAVLDGLIVCLAAALAEVLLLGLPAARISTRPLAESVVAGLYPVLDVVFLMLLVNLTFTARSRPPSLTAYQIGALAMGVGDTAYAIIGVTGRTYASPLLDAPFLIAYTMLGVATLHPSVVELSRADRRTVQAWSWRRTALLAPALATPFLLLALVRDPSNTDRLLLAGGGALIVVMLLARAVSAVRAQAQAQRYAEHQARHDPLTGLPNRRMFAEDLARMTAGPARIWVYLLDLDGFKYVNDSWGHDTGDLLVIEVAARLRAAAPRSVAVAALGGDEFGLAYAGDAAGADRLTDAVRGCFARPFPVRDTELTITAAIGLASAPDGDPAAPTPGAGPVTAPGGGPVTAAADCPTAAALALIRDADTAMHQAKTAGPGECAVFDARMHERVRERIELEVALRRALGEGQLTVAYQPIVDVRTGMPRGAEALARWTHPERGAVPPDVFIPLAEAAGLIGAVGDQVRREALRRLGGWRTDGTVADDFYLSVNVSPRQLTDPELPLIVSAELLEFGVPARCVAVEMTEAVLADHSPVVARVLHELRELGVGLLIDDFGTGFSALGYLRRFPVTGMKIDRSFVTGLGSGGADDEIVRAVVAMSQALGLSVIAEGVETRVQRDALAAIGVTSGQGWLWGPAVPPADFAAHWHVRDPATPVTNDQPVTGRQT